MKTFNMAALLTVLLGCGGQPSPPAGGRPTPIRPGVSVYGAVFSRDGKLLLTSYRITNPDPRLALPKRLALWDTATGKKVWAAEPGGDLLPVGFTAAGKAILLWATDSLQIWDVKEGKLRRTFARGARRGGSPVLLSANGKVALTHTESLGVQVWDTARGELLREITKGGGETWVALSPDGRRAYSVRRDRRKVPKSNLISVWDLTTGKKLRSFELRGWPLAFSPDGKFAVTGDSKLVGRGGAEVRRGYLVLWDVTGGKKVRQFERFGRAIAFTPDGQRLIIGIVSDDAGKSWLTALDIASSRMLFNRRVDSVNIFAFSPEGGLAFTGSGVYAPRAGSTIKLQLWDLTSGKLLRSLRDPVEAWKPLIGDGKP